MSSQDCRRAFQPTRSSRASAVGGALAAAMIAAATSGGCSSCYRLCCEHSIEAEVAERMGSEPVPAGQSPGLASSGGAAELVLPNGADESDGLSEDEAVLVGLWNN